MSTRNEALRSVHVRTIFAVIVAAFFPHSGSTLRRLAISSKNALVKYCTMDAALAGRKSAHRKKARMAHLARDRDAKGFTDRGLCAAARGKPSPVKGEGLKIPSRRGSQVRILAHPSNSPVSVGELERHSPRPRLARAAPDRRRCCDDKFLKVFREERCLIR